ncbi:TPA: hypothetical protein ACGATL_000276 [Raoultella ornithinolytica]
MTIPPPYEPYEWADNLPLVYALKAMHEGKATEEQQKLVLNGLMGITAYYDLSYRPGSERDTAFAEGKRFVGAQVVKMINLTGDVIEKSKQRKQQKK